MSLKLYLLWSTRQTSAPLSSRRVGRPAVALASLSLLLVTACSQAKETPQTPTATPLAAATAIAAPASATPVVTFKNPSKADTSQGYAIQVFSGDKQVASITLEDLSKLPQVSLVAADRDQSGPTLLSVLALAGISDFSEVTVGGWNKGRVATAELTLKRAQVNDTVLLDFSDSSAWLTRPSYTSSLAPPPTSWAGAPTRSGNRPSADISLTTSGNIHTPSRPA